MGVRYPLDRWWRAVETAPSRLDIHHDGDDVWSLRGDGRPIGYVYGENAAQWWKAVHDLIPMLILSLEEVLWQRDLLISLLVRDHPMVAVQVVNQARIPLVPSGDWRSTTASAAAAYLAERARHEEHGPGEADTPP